MRLVGLGIPARPANPECNESGLLRSGRNARPTIALHPHELSVGAMLMRHVAVDDAALKAVIPPSAPLPLRSTLAPGLLRSVASHAYADRLTTPTKFAWGTKRTRSFELSSKAVLSET